MLVTVMARRDAYFFSTIFHSMTKAMSKPTPPPMAAVSQRVSMVKSATRASTAAMPVKNSSRPRRRVANERE